MQVLLGGHLVDVRENLWSALWQLRLADEDRILWIDALCIDQNNVVERNHQVGLMSRIYTKAFEVLAWLGPASDASDVAMDYLATVFRNKKPTAEQSYAVIELCRLEYWQRMWILQEFGLASDITLYCGSKSVHWGSLDTYCNENYPKRGHSGVAAVQFVMDYRAARRRQKNDQHTLITLLAAFNTRQCADLRDTVFALLGMASDCGGSIDQMAIKVDYSQSLFGIYMNVFKVANQGKPGKTTTPTLATYSQVLLSYLQCFTTRRLDITGKSNQISSHLHYSESAFRLRNLKNLIEARFYTEAQSSLQRYVVNRGQNRGHTEVLKWLESPCGDRDTNDVGGFRSWPFNFPDAVRQVAKLCLFVTAFDKQSRLRITLLRECTGILFSPREGQGQSVYVDNETGVIKVIWKPEELKLWRATIRPRYRQHN